jgi:hypothetical protein
MWMRKTLETSVAYAAASLADAADGRMELGAAHAAAVMEPLRQEIGDAAFMVSAALVALGACLLVAAVVIAE